MIKIGSHKYKPVSTYDGIRCAQIGGVAALRVLELLSDADMVCEPGAILGIVTAAPEYVDMCGALVGMSIQGVDIKAKPARDLATYGADVVRELEADHGVGFSDLIMAGSVLYRDAQQRIALDREALEKADFFGRIQGEGT